MVRTSTPTRTAPAKENSGIQSQQHLRSALRAQLIELPFAPFASCICDLLRAEGYADIRLAGRATYRGRNKEGGYDIEAFLPSPLGQKAATGGGVLKRKVIVQVKQFPHEVKVYQRTLDALRGACLRTGAIEAILITTSDFSPIVRNVECSLRREASGSSLAPVHLLNGDALVERLIAHRIGVRENVPSQPELSLDLDYFARLIEPERSEPFRHPPLHVRVSRTQTEVTLILPLTLFGTLPENSEKNSTKGGA